MTERWKREKRTLEGASASEFQVFSFFFHSAKHRALFLSLAVKEKKRKKERERMKIKKCENQFFVVKKSGLSFFSLETHNTHKKKRKKNSTTTSPPPTPPRTYELLCDNDGSTHNFRRGASRKPCAVSVELRRAQGVPARAESLREELETSELCSPGGSGRSRG